MMEGSADLRELSPWRRASPYTDIESVDEGFGMVVYRAVRNTDRLPVVLKVLDPRRCRPKDLERLKNDYELGKSLSIPSVVRPLALETYAGMPTLALEDFGGKTLDHLLGQPLKVEEFLILAIHIATAVSELHQHDVIHKDLKPGNILVKPATDEVKIADLGIATRLPREHRSLTTPSLIEGSLPYMSPEQTGRMNRSIDSRADLYALGVTFYEMLAGRRPFEARDSLEWVHCHVARAPPSLSALVPEVPEMISRLVLKLLAKMPEERYQSARGLRYDLERCLEQWNAHGGIESFPLGERDVLDRIHPPQKLYGREEETAALMQTLDRVIATGNSELVLVSGYSGIGKSSLVNELQKPLVREQGFFVWGKFDQHQRDIPYSTFVQAFRELVLELLAESQERIGDWKTRLQAALGINGQLMVDVIPQVELVIGPQPPVPALPPAEAQNRFRMVLRRFIGVFAQKENPLVLFLDDLQWVDTASLALLQDLVTHPEVRHLLVVGAYRDNEVGPAHPLLSVLAELRKAGTRLLHIVLGPLSKRQLGALIRGVLHSRREDTAPLAELVHEKTGGNPFFAIQFLTALYEDHLLELDGDAGVWRWDLDKIRAKGFTDNVVELMTQKLKRLPAATQEALKQVAYLGVRAEVTKLAMVRGRSKEETHADLWEAVRAGLILPSDDTYAFVHDRIQEAAYSLVPEPLRAAVHLRIGRLLLSRLDPGAIEERLFDIANQLNLGAALLTDPGEKEQLCRINFRAGTRAKAEIAYASARNYLSQATVLLPSDAWRTQYDEALNLHLELSECEYMVGDFRRADERFRQILENARSNLDRAKAYRLRSRLYQFSGRFAEGTATAIEALRLFGVTFPESTSELQAAFAAENQEIQTALRGLRIADLVDAPVATDPKVQAIIGVLIDALVSVFNERPALFPVFMAKAVHLSLQYGNVEESCPAYCLYGALQISFFENIPLGVQLSEMAVRLNEKFNDPRWKGTLLYVDTAHVGNWGKHIGASRPLMERAFAASLDAGDLVYAGYNANDSVWQSMERGDPLDEVLRLSRTSAAFAQQTHNDVMLEVIHIQQQLVASLKGTTRESTSFDDDAFSESKCLAALTSATFVYGIGFFHTAKQIASFIYGRYTEALASAERVAPMLAAGPVLSLEAAHHFYHALALAAAYPQTPDAQRQELTRKLEQKTRKLKLWADHCPENHLNRYALVSAEVARIEGRELEAERLYQQAIQSARDNGFVHNEGLANELASRFYRARGLELIADAYLGEARACYLRWGADGKVKQLDQSHPRPREARTLAPATTVAVRAEQLDLFSVLKASQNISSEIVLDELVRTLLRVVLEQGSGQKGYLLLSRRGELSVEAEARLEESGVTTRILQSEHLADSSLLPISVIRYAERTKERVILDDAAESAKFSSDPYLARERPRAVLCLPILRKAQVVGLLYLENNLLSGAFTPERLTALELLASQAAIALENARLYRDTLEAERRSAFLARAGELLSESLDYQETLARLGRLCVQNLSDWCVIDIVEGGELKRLAGAHSDAAKEPLLQELRRRYSPGKESRHPADQVLRSGEPLLLPEISESLIRSMALDEEHARLVRELGTRTGMSVPLVARGQRTGVLTLGSAAPGRRYGPADLELVQEVARRAAIAIDNARLYRETEEAVHLRDEFLSVATHELYTPVTSLKLSLQSMRRLAPEVRLRDPSAMERLIDVSLRQGDRLTALIDNLLEVSRIESGSRSLERAEMDLGILVRKVVDRFRPDCTQARSPVTIQGGGPVVGHWDYSRVDQVVSNLLANAIKFGAHRPIEISFGKEAKVARLAVRDHGIGIDSAQQARLFNRFERGVSARHYGGLGLGLYICRSIVEAHGGSIRVESHFGEGATFTVELPCTEQPQLAQRATPPSAVVRP